MKHSGIVTGVLIGIFVLSQLVGLALLAANSEVSTVDGVTTVDYQDTALGERPNTSGFDSFTYLIFGIAIGTAALLLLIRFNLVKVWKTWFLVAVTLAMTAAFGSFMPTWLAFSLALILGLWKVFKPNLLIHNITEVLVYSGIALIIAPIFHESIVYVSLLLVVIAIYDAYAVWRSKHMIAMANFQTDSKLFAGLAIPYELKDLTAELKPNNANTEASAKLNVAASKATASAKVVSAARASAKKVAATPTTPVEPTPATNSRRTAILGGGDIAFPLIFIGVVFTSLLSQGFSTVAAYSYSLIIVVTAAISLTVLFVYAEKDKFYPAIPFLATGCFVGYGIVWLLVNLL